jgi:hypothetical protein
MSDRLYILHCKTYPSYPEACKDQNWMCQSHVFVVILNDESPTLLVTLLIHI